MRHVHQHEGHRFFEKTLSYIAFGYVCIYAVKGCGLLWSAGNLIAQIARWTFERSV